MTVFTLSEPAFSGVVVGRSEPQDRTAPLVIDNGSSTLRAGYACDLSPDLSILNLVARSRDRRIAQTFTLIGNDILAESNLRGQAKSPYEGGVLANLDVMETVLDYTLNKLGVSAQERGVIITEPLGNPEYYRRQMGEFLFEAYSVSDMVIGIDALWSYYYSGGSTGIVVSAGNTSTAVLPVINGRTRIREAKRLNWGGTQSSEYLLKLLQLKYPSFPTKLTVQQAQQVIIDHCYVSQDYNQDLERILDRDSLTKRDVTIQFPYQTYVLNAKSEEEIALLAQRRRENGRRLQEQAAAKRQVKMAQNEETINYYRALRADADIQEVQSYNRRLQKVGFKDLASLEKEIKRIDTAIRRARPKEEVDDTNGQEAETESFPLLNIPDDQLDPDQLKQKRQQRLMKAGYEARLKIKQEKLREEEIKAEKVRLDEEKRCTRLSDWLEEKHAERLELIRKIKQKKRMKAELGNRKSFASQMRMKNIANLASDTSPNKRRKKDNEDRFGADDSDWMVYRDIAPGEDSDDEDHETSLRSIEQLLIENDDTFDISLSLNAQSDPSKSLMHAFLHGTQETPFDRNDAAQLHQIHLNVERIRVSEVLFQPSIAGIDQAGLAEIITSIVRQTEKKTAEDIYITGGFSLLDGFNVRLARDLRANLPVDCNLRSRFAIDPRNDAWRGAAKWWRDCPEEWNNVKITRSDWYELGPDYLKDHRFSNWSNDSQI